VPSLFRRKSSDSDLVDSAIEEVEDAEESAPVKGRTPSKRELGVPTPKRSSPHVRRPDPPPANRREATRRMRERQRAQRAESMEGMKRGDEKYLRPRDKGPERALVRDIVDARRTVGTWFFGGALIVLIGSSAAMPPAIRLVANLLWALLALGVVLDAILISRKIKKLIGERFPDTTQRPRSLYLYGIMRSITFRRMRMPKPRVDIGEAV